MKALIRNGLIVDVSSKDFPVHPDFKWEECPDGCNTSWTFNGEEFIPPKPEVIKPDPGEMITKKLNAMWHFCDTGDRSAIDAVKQEI